jgi:dienelactone hydrolase
MKTLPTIGIILALATAATALAEEPQLDPMLCQGEYLTVAQGRAMLQKRLAETPTREAWEAYAKHVRECILRGADLDPLPRRIPLNVITRNKRQHDGYSVENIAFETVPGYFAACNLYRPTEVQGPSPVVLCPHGHVGDSRFNEAVQIRCAMLAKMGATAMSISVFGWDSLPDDVVHRVHLRPIALTMQTWNNMRALDFLLSLDGVDPKRVGVTGASGGGTQTLLLTALDDRVTVSVPVVMVSSYMFGGCLCESGKPIHRSKDHFTNNAEITAMAAPRPLLVISDGHDWTAHTPDIEFPFIRKIYGLYGAERQVANAHFANEGHDYGPNKRKAMYRFMARHLGLDLARIKDARGRIDESGVVVEDMKTMQVFNETTPFPDHVCRSLEEIEAALRGLQTEPGGGESAPGGSPGAK